MKHHVRLALAFVITLVPYAVRAQVISNEPIQTPPPGNIKLLPGYVHEPRRGKDSRVGVIYKQDGLSIDYDIGRMAANYADQYFPEYFERLRKQTHLNSDAIEGQVRFYENQVVWRQRQFVNGDEVMIVLLKDSKLIASFVNSTANFVAKVDSSDKIADFLLTVLTYQRSAGKKE